MIEDFSISYPSNITSKLQGEMAVVEKAKLNSKYFRPLYERYFNEIFAFVFSRIKDQDESKDIVSQVFLKALVNIRSFKFKNVPFSAWLYKIALNEVNLFFRKKKRSRIVMIDDSALVQISGEVEDQNLSWKKEKLSLVLQRMTRKELDLLELRFHLGMSYKEIACVINTTEINARVRVHRVVNKIKDKWVE